MTRIRAIYLGHRARCTSVYSLNKTTSFFEWTYIMQLGNHAELAATYHPLDRYVATDVGIKVLLMITKDKAEKPMHQPDDESAERPSAPNRLRLVARPTVYIPGELEATCIAVSVPRPCVRVPAWVALLILVYQSL